MRPFVVQRALMTIPVLAGVTMLVFLLLHLAPGDPVTVLLGAEQYNAETAATLRREFGLDRPLAAQYTSWLSHLVQGDLGRSLRSRQPVAELIARAFPATLQLAGFAFALALLGGLAMGLIAALQHNRLGDTVVSIVVVTGLAIPNYFLAIVLVYVFSLQLRWLPPSGYAPLLERPGAALQVMLLPAICMALRSAAVIGRMLRSSLVETLQADGFVRTARSKGLSLSHAVWRHALKNAAIPVVTVAGIQAGILVGSTIIIETIFAWPGIGKLVADAIFRRDFPVVQGAVLVTATAVIALNVLVDILYARLDPRISYS